MGEFLVFNGASHESQSIKADQNKQAKTKKAGKQTSKHMSERASKWASEQTNNQPTKQPT